MILNTWADRNLIPKYEWTSHEQLSAFFQIHDLSVSPSINNFSNNGTEKGHCYEPGPCVWAWASITRYLIDICTQSLDDDTGHSQKVVVRIMWWQMYWASEGYTNEGYWCIGGASSSSQKLNRQFLLTLPARFTTTKSNPITNYLADNWVLPWYRRCRRRWYPSSRLYETLALLHRLARNCRRRIASLMQESAACLFLSFRLQVRNQLRGWLQQNMLHLLAILTASIWLFWNTGQPCHWYIPKTMILVNIPLDSKDLTVWTQPRNPHMATCYTMHAAMRAAS